MRLVRRQLSVGLQTDVLDIAGDADDGQPGFVLRRADLDALAYRVALRPEAARHALVDDHDFFRARVALVEFASMFHRNAHRAEIVRQDAAKAGGGRLRGRKIAAFDGQIAVAVSAADRQYARGADRLHAG